MKCKFFKIFFSILLVISSLFILKSCERTQETVSCFPSSVINVTLNLNLPAYYNLNNVGGWIYVNEQSSGTKGLIVVRTTGGFNVYDRNAPHICPGDHTTLEVEDGIKIVCPKDDATWILISGQPANNSSGTVVTSLSPKMYQSNFNSSSNVLSILN